MLEEQIQKLLTAIAYAAKDNADFTAMVIDTQELVTAEFHVYFETLAVALAVFKIMESDTKTNATTLGGTPTLVKDLTKPTGTQDGKWWVINLRRYLQGSHKRYIQLQAKAGNGSSSESSLHAHCLAWPKLGGSTATERGVDAVIVPDAIAA